MSRHADVLLVHVPRLAAVLPRVLLMPMGLLLIADHLERNGVTARVLHTGVEAELDPAFSLAADVSARAPMLVGFALQWHQQATDVLAAVRAVKAAAPGVPIVLGGFTASRFAAEILATVPEVAFVIHGDAELPMLALARAVRGADPEAFETIPNLVFRRGGCADGAVVENAARWQLSAAESRALSFSRFDLVENQDRVAEMRMDAPGAAGDRVFYFSPGRGCDATCAYCAGARSSQKKYERRDETVMFPVDHVAAELVKIQRAGTKRWNNCFDPQPASPYYLELFAALRERGIGTRHELDAVFDCFGLPTEAFLRSFATTFGRESSINISPETGNEQLRRKLRTFYYSNAELFERLALVDALALRCSLYFAVGLPRETRADFATTVELVRRVRAEHPRVWVHVGIIDIEPGSMLFDKPESLGVQTPVRDLATLLAAQASGPHEANYATVTLSSEDIVDRRRLLEIVAACKVPADAPFERELLDIAEGDALRLARNACAPCAHARHCYGGPEIP